MEVLKNGEKQEGILYTKRNCCFGIVERNGLYLLVYSHKDDNYSFPGGGIESGESLEDTTRREFLEEAGYAVSDLKKFVEVYSHIRTKKGIYMEKFDTFFVVSVDEKSKQTPLEDWHERVWVKEEDVRKTISASFQRLAFDYYLNNVKNKEKI